MACFRISSPYQMFFVQYTGPQLCFKYKFDIDIKYFLYKLEIFLGKQFGLERLDRE